MTTSYKLSVEVATLCIATLGLIGSGITAGYAMLARKDFAEAEKARAETILLQMKTAPRADIDISESSSSPWVGDPELCTITGLYTLKNSGEAPIAIDHLRLRVFEVALGEPPSGAAKVNSISTNTRLDKSPAIFEENLADSNGLVFPGESYSRSYGYIIRRDVAKQYLVEASPQPASSAGFRSDAFRTWSKLGPICLPTVPRPPPISPQAGPEAPATPSR